MTDQNDTAQPDDVNLCKGCNTMKHLNDKGLCGRCAQPDSGELEDEDFGATSSVEYWPTIPRSRSLAEAIEVLVKAHTAAALQEQRERIVASLPKSYKDKVGLDVAQLWDSADATDGYNQALADIRRIVEGGPDGDSTD